MAKNGDKTEKEDDDLDQDDVEPEEQEEKAPRERRPSRPRKKPVYGHPVWGMAFIALGVLVLISLVSFFVNNTENVLGPYFGTGMAKGLVYLFGALPSLLFPLSLCFIGWKNLAGTELKTNTLLFISALVVEISLVFAIHNLPALAQKKFTVTENLIGNAITDALHYLFGSHEFGPYFISFFAIAITGLLCFRINPVSASVAAYKFVIAAALWLGGVFSRPKQGQTPARAKGAAKPKKAETAAAEAAGGKGEEIDEVEHERQLQQERDLQAFRQKLKEPIKITTMAIEPEDAGEAAAEPVPEEALDTGEAGGRSKAPVLPGKPIENQNPYRLPSPDVLSTPPETALQADEKSINENSQILERTLLNFDIEGKVSNVCYGPVVTRYEIELAPGVKVARVLNLQNDIAMAVGGQKIRIEAPIPGKAAIGIELPNKTKQIVHFKHILMSDAFKKAKAKLPMIVGQNISGVPFVTDVDKMPHLLVAGQTGSGKSVCINAILCSLLMTKTPHELRMIMIDPKKVELTIYEGIPHLVSPVVTEPKEAVKALYWVVMEIQRRFALLKKLRARDIEGANARLAAKEYAEESLTEDEKIALPRIVIFVDELADLMLTASKDVESHILRIAQLGRAAGIHLVVATQRPSVDIITGPIKANLASRMAFRTIQSIDSRTILGHQGAEQLLGEGDMLFLRNGAPDLERYHGAYISEKDVESLAKEINDQHYEMIKFENFSDLVGDASAGPDGYSCDGGRDDLFDEAARMIVSMGQGSTSLLQRRMKIGYARAGRIMDELHQAGIVGPPDGSKMREVRMKPDELEHFLQGQKSGGAAGGQSL
ncbi:MAG TPA: DNA translocase FtsK [Chitinivibrionales bacterium]|nr:DNA translocase FtsK [Chitinivibrionales bacterium]